MKCNIILLLFLLPSISFAQSSYDIYEKSINKCIAIEKEKPSVTKDDVKHIEYEKIYKYLSILKNLRIQKCSYKEEMQALVDELSLKDDVINTKNLRDKYLSIYNKHRLNTLSDKEKKELEILEKSFKNKNLEVKILKLMDVLKNK